MFRSATALAAGAMALSVALANPAAAKSGTTSLTAGNGTVGVNQVLTATFVSDAATTSCDDEPGGVNFGFKVGNGTDLGTVAGTCTPVSNGSYTPVATWTDHELDPDDERVILRHDVCGAPAPRWQQHRR